MNPLTEWNRLCGTKDYINQCKEDRIYIFPSNQKRKTFNESRKFCKSLIPCEGLGDLISIRNCVQLNEIVNLTNHFINQNRIADDDVQVWTSRLKDLKDEQNLVSRCQMKSKFDTQSILDSNYSILEVETPRLFVRNSETKDEINKNNYQLGYVLCEILKPVKDEVCKVIPKCPTNSTENPFNWANIQQMIDKKENMTQILRTIHTKFDTLMETGSVINLIHTIHKLNKDVKSSEFKQDGKEITSTLINIFSTTLDKEHSQAWTKINYTQRKNASIELIIQMNNLIENNFCLLNDNQTFEFNSSYQSEFGNRIKSENILLEASKIEGNHLENDFKLLDNLGETLEENFGRKNLIYFPVGLSFDGMDLDNAEMKCKRKDGNKSNFATAIIYKNLAKYLHYNRLFDKKSVNVMSSQANMDDYSNKKSKINSKYDHDMNDEDTRYSDLELNSELVAFSFNNIIERSIKLPSPVRVQMQHLNNKQRLDKLKCVFWNFTTKEWIDDGCRLVFHNKLYSTCECDHLTNFAILMDISGREQNSSIKSALSMLCAILSIFGLLITIVVFTFIPKLKSKRNLITANLCFNLLIVNVLVGFFLEIKHEIICRMISIVLFYFLINSFCWMLIQGYFLYQMIVLVFNNVGYFRLKYMILYCNGFSMIWLAIVLLIIGPEGFYNSESSYFCWFSDPNKRQRLWFFLIPVLIISMCNLAIIALSFKETYRANKRRIKLSHIPKPILRAEASSYREFSSKSLPSHSSNTTVDSEVTMSKVKSWFRGWITLIFLLGLTWIVGFLMIIDVYSIASYIFILLNSLQGFYIFLFEICFNIKSRTTIIKLIRDKLVVRYLIITSKESAQMSTKTNSSTITPISGLTTINDSGEISSVYINRINTLNNNDDNNDKFNKSKY